MSRVPKHVAIIMDGNGRWAQQQGLDRLLGHKAGIDALHRTIEGAKNAGVKYITAYTFSTENWNRPQAEVEGLMQLIIYSIEREVPIMIEKGVRLQVVGDMSRIPAPVVKRLDEAVAQTADGAAVTLLIALNYGSRLEIATAARALAQEVADGKIRPEDVCEESLAAHLWTAGVPDPELLVRTGGEERISNYLLWQCAYSEFYFCDTFWPDFNEKSLYAAIVEYQSRERRFGKTSAQVVAEESQK